MFAVTSNKPNKNHAVEESSLLYNEMVELQKKFYEDLGLHFKVEFLI